ncbi:putative peptidoglycan lipid II flippase [Planomicrobium soli]|uniref:Probable lipid II flippase MurJ n=1 Tax=Planomicrobium soli TaxID=1176648 RepID=A0A2P8H3K4_9BACL|nr:murein biosynthesis integral membrane protein MurJ [Planomicrobium soli]PSL40787.1 putative peptidoglycan lipid II flippase [Planomicrobium soli]
MGKTVISIMIVVIITKILGFSRDIFLSFFFGADGITDAYLVATDIPTAFFSLIGMGIAAGYIPIYTSILEKQGIIEAKRFTVNLINSVLLISTLLVLMILIFPSFLVHMFASGFEGETLKIAVAFTRISALSIYFVALIYVFSSYLEVHKRFLPTVLSGLPLNFIMIFFIYVSAETNVYLLAVGTLIAVGSQLLVMIPAIYRTGYRHSFHFSLKDKNLKKLMILAVPVIIGVSADQINILVDRTIASQIAVGGISALTYSHRVVFFIQAIFVLAIVKVVFPKIAQLAVRKDHIQLKRLVERSITIVALIVIPAALGLMMFSKEVTDLLFGRGAFDSEAAALTTGTLFFYSVGLLGFGLREVLTKVFYSLEDMKTPMISAVGAMALNVVLNIILSKLMGINGLALATSLAALLSTAILYVSLVRKIGSLNSKRLSIDILKASLAAVVMGISAKGIYSSLISSAGEIGALTGGVVSGIIIYTAMIWLLQFSEVADYKARILSLAKR